MRTCFFTAIVFYCGAFSGCGGGTDGDSDAKQREEAKKIATAYLDDASYWAKSASKTLQNELKEHADFLKSTAANDVVMDDPTVDLKKKAVLERVSTAIENLDKAEQIAIQNSLTEIVESCKKLRDNIKLIKSSADALSP